MNKIDFDEISQSEYRRLKIDDPQNYHSYTARVVHKYFRKKHKFPIVLENDIFRFFIDENYILIIEKIRGIEFSFHKLASLPLLIQALNKYQELKDFKYVK